MQLLGRSDMLEVDYKHLQINARICCRHFRDWAFTSSTKERLIRFALPEIGPPPPVFGSGQPVSIEVQQTPGSSMEGQEATKNSDEEQDSDEEQGSNEEQQTRQNNNVQQMPKKIIQCSNEVLQILKNSTIVQQTPQNIDAANQTPENGNEAQKTPQKSNVKIILKNSDDVKHMLKNSNEVEKTQNSIPEQKGIKRKKIVPRKNLLQGATKEVTKEETTTKLKQYLKNRKAVLQKLRKSNPEISPQKRNSLPQKNCKKARLRAPKKRKQSSSSSSDEDSDSSESSSDEEEWAPSKSKDVKVKGGKVKDVKVKDVKVTTIRPPNSTKRVPFDEIEAKRMITNQRCVISKLKKQVEKLRANKHKFTLDLKGQMNPEQYGFVMSQIKQCKRSKEGRRWTKDDKMFALRIYLQSPDAYRILREKLSFPSQATLKKYSKKLDLF